MNRFKMIALLMLVGTAVVACSPNETKQDGGTTVVPSATALQVPVTTKRTVTQAPATTVPEMRTTSAPTPPAKMRNTTDETVLRYLMKEGGFDTDPATIAAASRAAVTTCELFDRGGSVEAAALTSINSGFTAEETGWLFGAFVYSTCPNHKATMDAFKARHTK